MRYIYSISNDNFPYVYYITPKKKKKLSIHSLCKLASLFYVSITIQLTHFMNKIDFHNINQV